MGTYLAHPVDEAQAKAVKAFFEALQVPYETELAIDETDYLQSTKANKERLIEAIKSDKEGKGTEISLDEIWK